MKMLSGHGGTINPTDVRKLVSSYFSYITDGSQHDSHEFFVCHCSVFSFVVATTPNSRRRT